MKTIFYVVVVLAVVVLNVAAQTAKNEIIKVARATAAVAIDGRIEEKEWRAAAAYELSGGGKMFLKTDGEYFYVALRGARDGWSQIYLSEGESTDVYVLHASAALGASVYRLDKNLLWQPSGDFAWELRDRAITAETRRKMADYLARNFWVANNNNMNNKNESEFQIKLRDPSTRQIRLAVEYVTGDEKQFFPATLADDSLNSKLAAGYAVRDVKFDHRQWAVVSLVGK